MKLKTSDLISIIIVIVALIASMCGFGIVLKMVKDGESPFQVEELRK